MDAFIAVLVIAGLYVAFRTIGYWRWVWLSIAGLIGGWEVFAVVTTGKTISQQYWGWAETSPWWWVPALCLPWAVAARAVAGGMPWCRPFRCWPW